MARKPLPTTIDANVQTLAEPSPMIVADMANSAALVHLESQQAASVRAVAAQLGYQLPADCTDPDLIQRDIAANMRRSVEAVLEVGRGLRVLKEACERGNFLARLDVLGIEARVAQKFMQSAAKFSNAPSTALLKAAGGQGKLFEMLVLDDEQIEELELTGQTGDLKLDDIATMSVKELRAALRESREHDQVKDRLLSEKNAKLDELAAKAEKSGKKKLPIWPDEIAGFKDDLNGLGKILDEALGKTLTIIDFAEEAIDQHEEGSDAFNGYKTVVHHIGEHVERLATLVAGLRNQYEKRLSCYVAIDKTNTLED